MFGTSAKWLCTPIVPVSILAVFTSACLESRADGRLSPSTEKLAKRVILNHKCGSCHTLQAYGLNLTGKVGPDLSQQAQRGRSPKWLSQQITNPVSIPEHELLSGFEKRKKFMPKFNQLSDRELNALVEFLQNLN